MENTWKMKELWFNEKHCHQHPAVFGEWSMLLSTCPPTMLLTQGNRHLIKTDKCQKLSWEQRGLLVTNAMQCVLVSRDTTQSTHTIGRLQDGGHKIPQIQQRHYNRHAGSLSARQAIISEEIMCTSVWKHCELLHVNC